MILTAHQPVYLPWLGLFHKIALADKFVFFNEVQYLPKNWNNRNKIKSASGESWLTVPVLRKGYREKKICEIGINNNEPWRRKHWRAIYFNYKNAPYFNKYASFFEDVYQREWHYLSDLNEFMLKWFLDTLGIRTTFLRASDFHFQGEKSDLVLDMCKQLGVHAYIFGALGRDYARGEDFEAAKIQLLFQDYQHPIYPQQYEGFISHLSIIDLLFNCGDQGLEILMRGNVSREDVRRILTTRGQHDG